MIRGIILSHTPLGPGGFCTNIALKDPVTGTLRQIRPRLPPNEPLLLRSLGYTPEVMQEHWRPGHYVDIEGFKEVAAEHRRSTHPEDVNVTGSVKLYSTVASAPDWQKVTQAFTFKTIRDFMPQLEVNSNYKGSVKEDTELKQSVGYVRAIVASFEKGFKDGSYNVRCRDSTGFTVCCPLKDELLLARLNSNDVKKSHLDVLVRFSLSGYFDKNPPCWLMVSHLIGV